MTFPLLVKSDGQKFGKSESGAVWLSSKKFSPYEFYQFLFRTPDADVVKCLKMLTFVSMEEIRGLEESMQKPDYVPNTLQKRLASEVTKLVHGEEALEVALKVTEAAAPGSETLLDVMSLEQIARDMPSCNLTQKEVVGVPLVDILVSAKAIASKSEARRMISNGGIYLNNQKINDTGRLIASTDLLDGRLLLLAVGKKNKTLVRIQKNS